MDYLDGAYAIMKKNQLKERSFYFPITVEEELGHMEGKKVLEELVGACANTKYIN